MQRYTPKHNSAQCKYCGDWIVWVKTRDRAYSHNASFDVQGHPHPCGVHLCGQRPFSLRYAGDLDSMLREQWRDENVGAVNAIGMCEWQEIKLRLSDALCLPGAPFQWRTPDAIVDYFTDAYTNDYGIIDTVAMLRPSFNDVHRAVHGFTMSVFLRCQCSEIWRIANLCKFVVFLLYRRERLEGSMNKIAKILVMSFVGEIPESAAELYRQIQRDLEPTATLEDVEGKLVELCR